MFMIINAGRFAGALFAILAVWFAVLVTVPVIHDRPGQYLVVGPGKSRLAAVRGSPALLISDGPGYTQIALSDPGRVAQLYAQGAWLVFPAADGGCLRLSDWQRLTGK